MTLQSLTGSRGGGGLELARKGLRIVRRRNTQNYCSTLNCGSKTCEIFAHKGSLSKQKCKYYLNWFRKVFWSLLFFSEHTGKTGVQALRHVLSILCISNWVGSVLVPALYPKGGGKGIGRQKGPRCPLSMIKGNLDLQAPLILEPNIPTHSFFLHKCLNQQMQPKDSRAPGRAQPELCSQGCSTLKWGVQIIDSGVSWNIFLGWLLLFLKMDKGCVKERLAYHLQGACLCTQTWEVCVRGTLPSTFYKK